jgi:large subunit ribosomal protein L17
MLSNMATSLILHKRINTTTAKAKALRMYVEPLLTRSKEDTTHSRRMVFSYLQSKEAVNELFREVATKVAERPGGYTRIIKMDHRQGDNADMCIIELVDYNENLLGGAADDSKTTGKRRRRRGSGTSKTQEQTPAPKAKKTEEKAPVEAAPVAVETDEAPVKAEVDNTEAPVDEVKTDDKTAEVEDTKTDDEGKEKKAE